MMSCFVKRGDNKRRVLVLICAIGFALTLPTFGRPAQEAQGADVTVTRFATAELLRSLPNLHEGTLVETAGFYAPGDGGDALYRIEALNDELKPNGANVIALKQGLAAVLLERAAVNYRMFGAQADGESDDGVPIKLAHEYANRHRIPVVNLSGEFWIKYANNIVIKTNVWQKGVMSILLSLGLLRNLSRLAACTM